jgi:hypothetical protein
MAPVIRITYMAARNPFAALLERGDQKSPRMHNNCARQAGSGGDSSMLDNDRLPHRLYGACR